MARSAEQIRADMASLQAELAEAERLENLSREQDKARRVIFLVASMKSAFREIEETIPGTFGEAWKSVPQQAWPREKSIGNKFELSETEVFNLKEQGQKAVRAKASSG